MARVAVGNGVSPTAALLSLWELVDPAASKEKAFFPGATQISDLPTVNRQARGVTAPPGRCPDPLIPLMMVNADTIDSQIWRLLAAGAGPFYQAVRRAAAPDGDWRLAEGPSADNLTARST